MEKYQGHALHTDLYQINMGYVYFKDGIHERKSYFDLYFRKAPFAGGYSVFAGLERIVDYINNFSFTSNDIEYLRDLGYDEDYLSYLKELKFTGSIKSVVEGEIVFANEPLVRVEAPLIQAQLIETALLNIVNYQTLIATKASRIKSLCADEKCMEFGTRRAHEFDAAIWGTRAAVIGGFDGTSNVKAAKIFNIKPIGTHAHSFVQTYQDEYVAFKKYAEVHKDCYFLVDTYDTLRSGIPNAIRVAKKMGNKINFRGIRLDSGDIAYLSKEARKMLDAEGFTEAEIVVSNDLDEATITHLKQQGAKVNVWGVGTKLITAYENPALGAVYKLTCLEDENGQMIDRLKISENPAKLTVPGRKKLYRIINRETKMAAGDYIALEKEDVESYESIKLFHPTHTYLSKEVKNFEAINLHKDIFVEGRQVYTLPHVNESKVYLKEAKSKFWTEYTRLLNPEFYPVDLSYKCWENRNNILQNIKNKIKF
ncbi:MULTISPECIES: nicotinate phosphoribosyltransferase [unclassified Gemella]|uniref:nicotinate phosphoribosyltransferase n=1 Tax=unclassified Gemella TaxID=2624949 RepID=UPI0010741CCA|nr:MULTISPECIES: nicotinate phosphoribosyltransferase [unclassified Gemella]MBF0710288.1 nicotinate phosphoribosyltransferase [Gemella sp. GL1.1]MBF0746964.1 nicotinate phosphoribosyltransferase [Gemella sp. 19428wG2_WT2a]NYS27632.1 nicotinate phosphoribosyltransferase [Gemella sp. GL1]TFU58783.1 nicotinate phosphoribosyltransferase [Gemella sp. WT2a]